MPHTSQPSSLSRQLSSALSKFKFPNDQLLSLLQFSNTNTINKVKQIQAQIIRRGQISNTFLATKLLERCAVSALDMGYALRIFDAIDQPNGYTWTTMIRGFVASKNPSKAIEFYDRMQHLAFEPNKFTFIFILKAYSMIPTCKEGRVVHGRLVKSRLLSDEFVCSALVCLYTKCGEIENAFQLFGENPTENVVTWNTMLAGCFASGDIDSAQRMLDEMPQRNVASWNAAISGYCKWGHVDLARAVFDKMPERDLISWSAMITGYNHSRRATEATRLFEEMLHAGIGPDCVTLVSVLSACSQIGALNMGKWIHAYVDRNKLRHDVVLGTSLVDMYAKCGCIDTALQVFHGIPYKNVFTWNAMICGLSMHGHGDAALSLFAQMELERVRPNDITFVGVLSACSHVGLVDEGRRQFDRMCKEYDIISKIEHYGCMVDLFGRAGLISEAKELIRNMPMEPNLVVLGALLNACKIHGDINDMEGVLKHLLKLGPGDGGCYVLLSNMYARRNRWGDVVKMRRLLRDMGLERFPGCSSIEVNSMVHEFVVEDKSHPNWRDIFEALGRLNTHMEDEGYSPKSSLMLYDIDEKLVWPSQRS
eukprot:TRINITY_DN33109_c0_g2_i1.p1 TRINITY_DN33109_c0_g2~~TRINITY_DN33109_c0_g2_i1.p1  ORF type:complete len:593 (-),score=101.32 TRINITY_DN33109_c0_g2_i1:398-2176(-)